ncbi:hypothetical protein, partial [Mycobacterium colombiense]|uniref:hypothetical protein n=1 Tax=Mycobacterium colombiense TaxID=339268 RepID=UPI003AF91672
MTEHGHQHEVGDDHHGGAPQQDWPPAHPVDRDFPDCTVVPGFIDMHVHGGGGAS